MQSLQRVKNQGRAYKSFLLISVCILACAEPDPVATGPKTKLPLASSTPEPAPPAAVAGDAVKGETSLKGNCLSSSCHGGGPGHTLTKADIGQISGASKLSFHKGLEAVFQKDTPDIEAFLAK